MRLPVRAAVVETVAAVLLLGAMVVIFVLVFRISGAGPAQAPGTAAILFATVVVALVVRPVHRRLRRDLRKRLLSPTLPPVEVLRRLSAGVAVGSATTNDERRADAPLPRHLLTVVHRALQTSLSELWIMVDGRPQAAAWLPESTPPPRSLDTANPTVHPIMLGAVAVGYLRLETAEGRQFSSTETRLLDACAGQAGLVLALIARQRGLQQREAELTARAAELRRSRVHLLDVSRRERRKLERDLHDGAQQQLIALGLSVQLARQLRSRAPDRAGEVLHRAADQARRAGVELERLTQSRNPAALRDRSLAAALRQATDGAGVRITVEAQPPDVDRDLADQSRDSVYFVALEAVQNAIKHAATARIRITMTARSDLVVIEIIDQGSGFDPARTRPGAGMANMRRRIADIGGDLTVRSAPGAGTTIMLTVPCRAAGPPTAPPTQR